MPKVCNETMPIADLKASGLGIANKDLPHGSFIESKMKDCLHSRNMNNYLPNLNESDTQ